MLLRIVGGNDTITLSGGGGVSGCTYAPQPPSRAEENVAESAEVVISAARATALDLARRIERMFALARERQRSAGGERVYVEYRTHDAGVIARSELLDGGVLLSTTPRLRDFRSVSPVVKLEVQMLRRGWWEEPLEEVPLATSTQGLGTGGRTINNRHDAALQNWVEIPTAHFAASSLAPATIFSITTNTAIVVEQVFVGVNQSTPYNPLIEAEARLFGEHTAVTAAGASGGSVLRLALGSSGQASATWSVPAATVQALAGRPVRVLLRQYTGANATARAQALGADGRVLWTGGVRPLRTFAQICDLGVMQLPPGAEAEAPGFGEVRLRVQFWGGGTFDLDYIFLAPQDAGFVSADAFNVPAGGYIEVGSHPPYAGVFSSVNQMRSSIAASSNAVLRAPARARIYCLVSRDSGAWPADSYILRLFTKRRRLTV